MSETGGRRRRIYEVSPQGKKALAGHRNEWERFTKGVEAVLDHG